jgi:glycerol-3-phosphate dehydrogenase (NAD(P)+)
MSRICVLGGGAWGTALALVALRGGHDVTLWARDADAAQAIAAGRNPRYLGSIAFESGIAATNDIGKAMTGADVVLVVTPAQSLRAVLAEAGSSLEPEAPLLLCAKGIEKGTGKLLSEIAVELCPNNPLATLSGPSFATDVARGMPTAVAVAAPEEAIAVDISAQLSSGSFRCYSTADQIGVEVGGALKNVLAIAAGATIGAGLGASAQAALVTRGFVELRRIGAAFGAQPETLMGLSGLGDLLLTCASGQSRNFAYGLALGRGEDLSARPLAEGVATAAIAARLAAEKGVDAPIIAATALILEGKLTIGKAVESLMTRPLKPEAE